MLSKVEMNEALNLTDVRIVYLKKICPLVILISVFICFSRYC